MSDPQTTNILLAIPTRGSDVGTWDTPVNGDFNALDGYIGGYQTISVSSSPVTLTTPSGSVTPSGGPTQAQNAVLSFTGAMTANVQVTLPLPGSYIVENLTTGNFILSFAAAGAGQVVAVDQGESLRLYCNGTNVRFANLPRVGHIEIWAGLTAMPAWVGACTVPPFLLCDGTVYNFTTYPYLGKRLLSAFGGNGTTTFGVPDLRGRVALPYDSTFSRITAGGCGLNGQTIGAAQDEQVVTLSVGQIPPHYHSAAMYDPEHTHSVSGGTLGGTSTAVTTTQSTFATVNGVESIIINSNFTGVRVSSSNGLDLTGSTGGGTFHPNVQPSQVTGIAVIRAA